MWENIIIAYLHYIFIIILMGSVLFEHLLMKNEMNRDQIKLLGTADLMYGISAVIVLATGILRWFVFDKEADFYTSNPTFHIKLTLFLIVGILSIFPSLNIVRLKKRMRNSEDEQFQYPKFKRDIMFIRVELLLLFIMPLLGILISEGNRLF